MLFVIEQLASSVVAGLEEAAQDRTDSSAAAGSAQPTGRRDQEDPKIIRARCRARASAQLNRGRVSEIQCGVSSRKAYQCHRNNHH